MFPCFSNAACIGPVNNDESFRACVENQFRIQNTYLYGKGGKGGHDTEEGETDVEMKVDYITVME